MNLPESNPAGSLLAAYHAHALKVGSPGGTAVRPAGLSTAPDALALIKALRRRWVMALGLGLLLAGLVGTSAWLLVPRAKYTASATLYVATHPKRIIFEPQENDADYRTYQKTQVAMLKNYSIISDALSNPEIASLPTLQGEIDPEEWLEQHLKVDFSGGSEVLQVSLSGDYAEDIAKIVNSIVKSYMKLVVDQETHQRVARLDALKRLRENYEAELKLKRKLLKETVAAVGSTDPRALSMTQQFKSENLSLAQGELMRARSERIRAETELAVSEPGPAAEAAPSVPDSVIRQRVESDPRVQKQRESVGRIAGMLADAQRIAKNKSDVSVKTLRSKAEAGTKALNQLRAELFDAIAEHHRTGSAEPRLDHLAKARQQVGLWKDHEAEMKKEVERLQAELKAFNEGGLDMENERAELAIAGDVARKVGSEVEAVQVELGAPERVRILAEAKVPKKKDEYRKVKAGAFAGLAALVCTLLGISFWEFNARRVHSVEEVIHGLGITLIGTLPSPPSRNRHKPARPADRRWQGRLVESVDAARTMLLYASRAESIRAVMITSAVKGEGKTSLSCHLSSSLARSGRRTLLIDCDLRSPTAHRLLGLTQAPGLCEYLRGEVSIDEAIWETGAKDFALLPAGRYDASSLQCLAQDGFRSLLNAMKDRYDFIIVDSAPILPVADSLLVGQQVDAVIFSVLRDVSRLPMVYTAHERLETLGVKILGAVVNGVRGEVYGYEYKPAS